ncbi:MAG: hypothetical protein QMD46_10810 [Methanomicrobiales archaeon]|nr:hypothetical protein [Methanomicrobiales archaeon]
MVYCVVCDIGQKDLIVDSFLSAGAAEQFVQTTQQWFALPLRVIKLLDVRGILLDKKT